MTASSLAYRRDMSNYGPSNNLFKSLKILLLIQLLTYICNILLPEQQHLLQAATGPFIIA